MEMRTVSYRFLIPRRLAELYDSARLEVLPGAGHGFYGKDAEQAAAWVLEYLEAHKIPNALSDGNA